MWITSNLFHILAPRDSQVATFRVDEIDDCRYRMAGRTINMTRKIEAVGILGSGGYTQMRTHMRVWTTMALCIVVVALGCTPRLTVQVDSIMNKDFPLERKTYILGSGMQNVSSSDLYFMEYSRYVRKALHEQGYREVQKSDDAAMTIFFSYGMSQGRQVHETYTRPVYGTVGGHLVDVTVTERDASGQKTKTTKTVQVPYRTEVVGLERRTESYTLYTAHMVLEAKTQSETNATDGEASHQLWKTVVSTTNKLDDLRRLMPIMIGAAAPYLGQDTGQVITVKMTEDDTRAERFRESVR